MVDKVDDKQDDTVASFNEGFLEGIDDTVDPLDFADKPETPPKKEVVAEADEPVEQDETEGEEETPPVVAEKEEPAKEEPKAPLTKDRADEIYDLLEKRLPKEQPLEQPKAPEPAAKKEPEPEKPALTEEEVARLKELNTEWKDVSEMVALQLKSVADTISKEVAKQVAEIKRDVEQRIQPVQQSVELSAAERYDSAVREVHPEVYDPAASKAFGDELVEWVQKQPKYLQTAYTQAFESPDPQDAIDLITRFKNETGKVKEPEGEPEPAAAPVETTAEADKNKRLQLLKKPTSRQTKGADGDDPLDFEGGFKEMVREMSRAG